jgi:hypothetical protein
MFAVVIPKIYKDWKQYLNKEMNRLNIKCDVLIPSQITNQGYASEPAKQQSEPTDTLLFTCTRGAHIRIEDLSAMEPPPSR